jgi:hypothetical protein
MEPDRRGLVNSDLSPQEHPKALVHGTVSANFLRHAKS